MIFHDNLQKYQHYHRFINKYMGYKQINKYIKIKNIYIECQQMTAEFKTLSVKNNVYTTW